MQARNVDDQVFPASLEGLVEGETVCQRLTSSDGEMLFGTELLLSALEACGVDNARCGKQEPRGQPGVICRGYRASSNGEVLFGKELLLLALEACALDNATCGGDLGG